MKQIIIITGEQCITCRILIRRLEKEGIEFSEMDMKTAIESVKYYGISSIPAIILSNDNINDTVVLTGYSNKIFKEIKQFYLKIQNDRNNKLRYR